ncbi:MAG: tRNA (adenosine(37)-N6)-threonylcarbamoyltransferase complex dimerization subunit type 1 TsaB [Acidimicrobiia bacterium]
MYLLAIDTATPTVSVAVARDGRVEAFMRLHSDRRHAEQLTPAIERCLAETGIAAGNLGAVAVGVGPGLFTGLRVGVTAAKTIAFARQIPVVGVSSLALVAWPLRFGSRTIVAVIDARRHEVFAAMYQPVPGGVQRTVEPAVIRPDELLAELVARDEDVVLAGDGARVYQSVLAGYDHAEFAGPAFEAPSVDALVELATARLEREDFENAADLTPVYLRRVDAEEFTR